MGRKAALRRLSGLLIACVLGTKFGLGAAQDCESKEETCGQCLQEFGCFWCTSSGNGTSHCLPKTQLASCSPAYTENPQYAFNIVSPKPLGEHEQISPQRVQLKLRKNEKYEFQFQYRQSKNYPVDLYYIMDVSKSMLESKDKLGELGEKLAEEMKRKTDNFRIGFGSFVDKLAMPYVNTNPEGLKRPCNDDTVECVPPYSFRNHLSLMHDASVFSRRVKETKISGNLDTPEGGLDAIMQAIVCKEQIGWRPNARRLLVLSTDAVSHIAGDGKLGGVIEPNDGACHMQNNSYTDGLIYDYPSVSHVNYVARQNNINIIFAVVLKKEEDKDNLMGHYGAMSNAIENSKIGTLEGNSNNVVKFISDIYDQIRDSVRITSDSKKDVRVAVNSTCPGFVDGTCTSVKPGQTIDFRVTIEPLTCQQNAGSNKKFITIKPEGLEDSLIVELEVLCDCTCAAGTHSLDRKCNNHGHLECGICRCNQGRFGANCQCDRTESKGEDPSLCVKPGGTNELCSGHGKCICGKCECKSGQEETDRFYGKYCECDNFSCYLKCSGRGTCDCGKCDCHDGWGGQGCECSTDETQCITPGTRELCSGHGDCVCGQCVCRRDGEERYGGKFCKECTSCPQQRCEEFKPCVECQAYQSGAYANSSLCAENCTIFTANVVKKLTEKPHEGVKRCQVVVEKDCTILFEYGYDDDNNLIVNAEEKKSCPEPPPLLAIILGVMGSVLLIGIITLIVWKALIMYHDKREYARFMDERNNTRWTENQNPLYKPGTSHFQNPAYRLSEMNAAVKSRLPANTTKD